MHELSSYTRIETLLKWVVDQAKRSGGLQIIVCVMTSNHGGYKYLKLASEIKIGVVTQCCLSCHANKGEDQFLSNLCLKINAKLGGSNVELCERLPRFADEDNVMFIGADVNHPAARNTTCPSIAAVVGTINWPAANRYAARVQPQEHRKEKILNFGDGVSEGQFDMVLNEELLDLKQAISDDKYRPAITVVVAQKKHQTRFFVENMRGESVENLAPGTVVDTTVVHPFEFDFYLCSHFGYIGTSKPTHYRVLWDENSFTSDELQKLIYSMCLTYARCTKPVSLAPPVYYADLVAYRVRLCQEALMESESSLATSSSCSTRSFSSSKSTASFDQNSYVLHENLRHAMYFI